MRDFSHVKIGNIQLCRCIEEPRGRHGLEGYVLDETYFCERFKTDMEGKPYWRIWPDKDNTRYYEICGPLVFKRFFVLL
jgi:hypothetical protein